MTSESNDGSPAPTKDPSTLILRIGDTLDSHADEIDRVYRIYSALIFIVGVLAFVVTLLIVAVWSGLGLVIQIIFGIFDATLIGLTGYGLWAQKGFEVVGEIDWEVDRFRFITTLELLPPKGNTPQERLWNSFKEASHISDELIALPPEAVKFDTEVSGKSGSRYRLAIFAHTEPRNPLRRFLSKWTLRSWPFHFVYYHFLPNIHWRLHEDQLTLLILNMPLWFRLLDFPKMQSRM